MKFLQIQTKEKASDVTKDSMIRIWNVPILIPILRGQNLPSLWVLGVFPISMEEDDHRDLKLELNLEFDIFYHIYKILKKVYDLTTVLPKVAFTLVCTI